MSLGEILINRGQLDEKRETFVVAESRRVEDVVFLKRVVNALQEPKNFGGEKLRCFSPGMSIDYMVAGEQVHHQVCLHCLWVKTFIGGVAKEMRSLGKRGGKEFMAIYVSQFGTPEKSSE
jgi:hypothetical protein